MDNARNLKHLYARAGFGIRFEDLQEREDWSIKKAVRKLFRSSDKSIDINVLTENIDLRPHPKDMMDDAKKQIQEDRNKQEKDLNDAWMLQLTTTDAQLREKMTLFWHNHFACNIGNAWYEQQLNNIERENALGNFRTLLLQVSQSPAMLQFLNNQQNQKGHPNENFARELMELFTLGRGHYTEHDIRESARAFTGWAFDGKTGAYAFHPKAHDDGFKTFLGKTGPLQGEDIIDIILDNKQTAVFISTKLYCYLINDNPDPEFIGSMADVFYRSKYDISVLLEFVFHSDWFYDDRNIGNLIKSPIELLVGINRQFYISYQNPDVQMQFLRTLGQLLFRPPNVAGWAGGRNWIDSSSLMYRIKIPSTILNAGLIDFAGKTDPEDEAYLASQRKQQVNVIKRVQAQPDWDKYLKALPQDVTKQQIAEFMLEAPVNDSIINEVNNAPDIKSAVIQIVSTPEYQLC